MQDHRIYFAASIRGGRQLAAHYQDIITYLKKFGQVSTEHIGNEKQIRYEEAELSAKEIHDRDLAWLEKADVLIAEVTVPSLGVGYEIAQAINMGKPVLALYDAIEDFLARHRLSSS